MRRPSTHFFGLLLLALLMMLIIGPGPARADSSHKILIADPFIELHTGPGRGYPVFHVIERGREVTIVKRRTDWFELRTDRGVQGWAPREQMIATLEPTGEPLDLQEPARENYMSRRWQAGVAGGDFSGASMISMFGGYAFSDNLSIELTLNHIIGEFSNGYSATLGLMHVFVPEWRISPYFTLGSICRICDTISIPFTQGIIMSVSTRQISSFSFPKHSNPAAPFSATTARNPSAANAVVARRATTCSSSTTRTMFLEVTCTDNRLSALLRSAYLLNSKSDGLKRTLMPGEGVLICC